MTTAEVSLAGDRVVSGSIEIPAYGLWAADVVLADDSTLPASAPDTLETGFMLPLPSVMTYCPCLISFADSF